MDPRGYEDGAATPEVPFTLSPDGQLFEPSLNQVLDDQRAAGADVALTPTRFLEPGDRDVLKSAAKIAAGLGRDDTIFSVPISIAWLNATYIDQLIAVLARVPLPKGIFLGSQLDPLDNVKEAVANLRRLCTEAGHVAVLRTDFAAFDVAAHGGFAASIGTGGRLRHIIPPDEAPFSPRPQDQSPSVLVPDLIHFFKGSTLAKRYANFSAPACSCAACGGRRIDTSSAGTTVPRRICTTPASGWNGSPSSSATPLPQTASRGGKGDATRQSVTTNSTTTSSGSATRSSPPGP